MKKLIISVLALSLGFAVQAQEETESKPIEKDTTYSLKWGNKTIIIIDNEDDDIEIEMGEKDSVTIKRKKYQRHNHFAGIDLGVNGFLNSSNSVDLENDAQFMDLDYGRSISIGVNFWESYIPLFQEKLGLSVGMGVEFNKYALARDYDIVNINDSTFGFQDSTKRMGKNLFKSTMLNLPLMLETNIGKDADHSFHLAIGGMVSYRLGSKTKQKYDQFGDDYKVKNRTDFNMNPFRFSAVGRIGYGNFTLFATYSLTPLFEDDEGPELYPFTVGVSLATF